MNAGVIFELVLTQEGPRTRRLSAVVTRNEDQAVPIGCYAIERV